MEKPPPSPLSYGRPTSHAGLLAAMARLREAASRAAALLVILGLVALGATLLAAGGRYAFPAMLVAMMSFGLASLAVLAGMLASLVTLIVSRPRRGGP